MYPVSLLRSEGKGFSARLSCQKLLKEALQVQVFIGEVAPTQYLQEKLNWHTLKTPTEASRPRQKRCTTRPKGMGVFRKNNWKFRYSVLALYQLTLICAYGTNPLLVNRAKSGRSSSFKQSAHLEPKYLEAPRAKNGAEPNAPTESLRPSIEPRTIALLKPRT